MLSHGLTNVDNKRHRIELTVCRLPRTNRVAIASFAHFHVMIDRDDQTRFGAILARFRI